MLSITRNPNPEGVLIKFLKYSGININAQTIFEELDKHPYYPSLLAFSDVLNTFKIKNSAFKIELNQLDLIPCPFIAHTNLNNGDFVVVRQVNKECILVASDNGLLFCKPV